ncbi:MAG: hypothetical protein HUJ76_04200 [Parasporobacterium sp.]|nr:hypothetical protein [Parasporobacterium sp.]
MVIIFAVFIAAVVIIVCVSNSSRKSAEAEEGAQYIRTMEGRDPVAIENSIFQASRQKVIDEMKEKLAEDPDAVWKALSDVNTVLMGDSRVVGFDVFGFMDPSRVIAEGGATIRVIPEYYDTLKALNPNLLVLSYGVNDMNNYWYWETKEEYIAELMQTMGELNELLPNAYIYVQTMFPVTEVGLESSSHWAEIPDWNASIKAACEEHGFRYIDLEHLGYEHMDEYAEDGIHLMYSFYPTWGNAILMKYLEDSGAL